MTLFKFILLLLFKKYPKATSDHSLHLQIFIILNVICINHQDK